MITPEQAALGIDKATAALAQLETLQKYSQGVNLMSNQTGFGIAPVLGIDWKTDRVNIAAKYEFNTQMKMRNNSTLEKATEIESLNKFQDGTEVDEDAPALLTIGAQWTALPGVNINIGYHHYFDKSAHWYKHEEKKLGGGTNEYLAGVEWDITDRINVSAGTQITIPAHRRIHERHVVRCQLVQLWVRNDIQVQQEHQGLARIFPDRIRKL